MFVLLHLWVLSAVSAPAHAFLSSVLQDVRNDDSKQYYPTNQLYWNDMRHLSCPLRGTTNRAAKFPPTSPGLQQSGCLRMVELLKSQQDKNQEVSDHAEEDERCWCAFNWLKTSQGKGLCGFISGLTALTEPHWKKITYLYWCNVKKKLLSFLN